MRWRLKIPLFLFLNRGEIDRDTLSRSLDLSVDDFMNSTKIQAISPELAAAWQQVKQSGIG